MVSAGIDFVFSFRNHYAVPLHNILHMKIAEMCVSIKSDSNGIERLSLTVWVYVPPSSESQLFYILERHFRICHQIFGNIKYYNHRNMYINTVLTFVVFSFLPLLQFVKCI